MENLIVSVNLDTKTLMTDADEAMRGVFNAGWSAGNSLSGSLDVNEAWTTFKQEIYPVSLEDYRRGPLTLDDVSKRINKICADHIARCRDASEKYNADLEALKDDIEASSDIDQKVVATIVLGRVSDMLSELSQVVA